MTYPHGQEPPPKMFFGTARKDIRDSQGGGTYEITRQSIRYNEITDGIGYMHGVDGEDVRSALRAAFGDPREEWLRVDIRERRTPSQAGQTHYGQVDTWKPDTARSPAPMGQRATARPAPTAPRTFAPVAPRQPEPDAPDAEDDDKLPF